MVYRIYAEKKKEHAVAAKRFCRDIRTNLRIDALEDVRIFNRYDVEGVDAEIFEQSKRTIFSEPTADNIFEHLPQMDASVFAVEYLPGQFDQRADSCAQCIQMLSQGERPDVRTAKVYALFGSLTPEETERIKKYTVNPVEAREASLDRVETLKIPFDVPTSVPVLDGFTAAGDEALAEMIKKYGLAMDLDDLRFCRNYFVAEKRDPTFTELKMIDTYWSDHCRHTTFSTIIDEVYIDDEAVNAAFGDYMAAREELYAGNKAKKITLMNIATIAVKQLSSKGLLPDLDVSEEINACSVFVKANVNGVHEDYVLMFKNETHNHPTEIEPFGGAATCLGGAIRDPLSGRSYVYQAMRVTGAADPRLPVSETIPGKLPQSKLTTGAAAGYSSYGNQIGLATGGVFEIYHPGYAAKRLEIGAVLGAAPKSNIVRERPLPGDAVLMLGGRTGRDGCGGATGSSKAHTLESLATCGAEVQKGNPPEERKLQRLFRDPRVTKLIKRCNDFGAGGVSVAVGELADGLVIDLSKLLKKYEGLDGTELAISESQERMAVVVAKENVPFFMQLAATENIECVEIAAVTQEPRLRMMWNGVTTVDISREFLDSHGAEKHTKIAVPKTPDGLFEGKSPRLRYMDFASAMHKLVGDLNVCSQKGLCEMFDSTIGASSVMMPFGGVHQLSPMQYMAASLPVLHGTTDTVSVMAYGFDPFVSSLSPFVGAQLAVLDSVAKLVCAGVPKGKMWLTLQEYFERTKDDPHRWGKPFAALLGAYKVQTELGIAAIGGKDSMSGTFEHIDVPPTLVSFAVGVSEANKLVFQHFVKPGSNVYYLAPKYDSRGNIDYDSVRSVFARVSALIDSHSVLSARTVNYGGIAEAVFKMGIGNNIGFIFAAGIPDAELYKTGCASFVIETDAVIPDAIFIGRTVEQSRIYKDNGSVSLSELTETWQNTLEGVFPVKAEKPDGEIPAYSCVQRPQTPAVSRFGGAPHVLIPVFPGTNCEYDTAKRFEQAGAVPEIMVLRNITPQALTESVEAFAASIRRSQMLMFPGGFSGGDEPEGSGKFIAAFIRNPRIAEAVTELTESRDGLILGICNGFQALIKTGLLPYGRILPAMPEEAPTLTFNNIGRHQSMLVNTRVASVKTPWLAHASVGDIHTVPISHGEGRFFAGSDVIAELAANGQICTQYVDLAGVPTYELPFNPNGSAHAVEGICSADGRIFGKMGHSERVSPYTYRNVPGNKDQQIFLSGVEYFGW